MPYTLSHVAAVVPFSRLLARLRLLSAVVIGSMVPDFGYLLPKYPPRFETHSAVALVTFCLPIGMLSYWIFQRLMKSPLLSVLPDQAYMRWQPYAAPASFASLRQWVLAACGVLLGAVVHLVWDAFTHEESRGVRMFPELADQMFVHGHFLTGARILQGLSSLLGLLIVLGAIAYALRGSGHRAVVPRVLSGLERKVWVLVFTLVTLGLCVGFIMLEQSHDYSHFILVGVLAIALLRALVLAALLVSLLMQVYLRSKR
jgi:Domain of unknown function (DUF4184)